MGRTKKLLNKEECVRVLDLLHETYPEAECELIHTDVFELLVKVVLSAQTTDKSVNAISSELFGRWPDAASLAGANMDEVQQVIKTIGMFRQKSKNIVRLSQKLMEEFGGDVPGDMEELMTLPGVGRKSANVVLSVGFGEQHIAVDTHVFRVSNRIGLCREDDVTKTEESLMKRLPGARWTEAHHSLIWHGRRVCYARKPACGSCVLNGICLSQIIE